MKWSSIVLLGILLFSWSTIYAETLEPASFPSLVSSISVATPLEFCGEPVPGEMHEIRERLEKEFLISLWHQAQVILWLKRSRRYLPDIEVMLKQSGMPDDLKYVPIVESALRPHVVSKKGATGFWQFMKHTGRQYGLVINTHIDERRNIFASTKAAIRYFKDLYDTFGSWTLAAAGYNMGEGQLMAAILEQQTDTYYHLYLPSETERYVFKILSAKLIFSDPERYGFHLSEDDYYPPLEFDRVKIDCAQDTPIRTIAQAANTYFKKIRDLNPQVRKHYLPEGSHEILIPKGASNHFHARYQLLLKNLLADLKNRTYVVKKGDNLSAIAEQFNVPLAALTIWNRLDLKAAIHPGDQLIIYRSQLNTVQIDEDEGKLGSLYND